MKQLSKAARSWCLYDVANSVYATSVMTFIFPIYMKKAMIGNQELPFGLSPDALLPYLTSLSLFIVLILSPILGARADFKAARKKYLIITTLVGASATVLLGLYSPGSWLAAAITFLFANCSFVLGTLFYNALLKEVANDNELSRVSGLGWAIGYAGGFIAMAIHLLIIQKPELLGVNKGTATQIALVTSGIWWQLMALPLFINVKEKPALQTEEMGLKESFKIIPKILKTPGVGLFIAAFFFFNDAIQTTISQAANLADGLLGMPLEKVLAVAVAIQAVAIVGSYAFVHLERKWGTHMVLKGALINWCLILVWALSMTTQWQFWVLGLWVGLVMGVSQSAARTLFATMTPADQSAEYFSVYSLADRGGSMMGPMLFGIAASFNLRFGIVPVLLSMLIGTVLIWRLKLSTAKG